ncbi:MAG TPA: glycosyltransferase [bacterium]|nr:glycosyltransferase [bacterium]
MKKKIVFVDHTLGAGGAEKVTTTLIRALDCEKFEIHLVIIDKLGEFGHYIPKTVKIHELGVKNTRKALFPFRKEMKKINPDVVYTSLSRTTILSFLARIGLTYRIIARYPTMPSIEKKENRLKGWRYYLMRLFFRKVDTVIAQTEEMAIELTRFYKIKKDRLITVFNPVDERMIDESLINADNPFNKDKTNILAVGTIYPVKGFDVLIRAFKKVVDEDKSYMLHIVGADFENNLSGLIKLVEELNLSKNVVFHGYQQNPYTYLNYCDLFVLSSRREGLPNVVLEAQYLCKPVVATNCVPVISRLITEGETGYVVEVENVDQMAVAIKNFRKLKPAKIRRESISKFIEIFTNEIELHEKMLKI